VIIGPGTRLRIGVHQRTRQLRQRVQQGVLGADGHLASIGERPSQPSLPGGKPAAQISCPVSSMVN